MNELQAKIKAIQTELESICADVSKSQPRATTLVDSPDVTLPDPEPNSEASQIKAPLEPFPVNTFTNSNSTQRHEAIRAKYQTETSSESKPRFQSEFRPPSSHISLPRSQSHSQPRSQSAPSDRSVVQSPVHSSVFQARVQQPVLTRSPNTAKTVQPLIRPALQELKAQAEHINQISQTQETALRRLQSIAAQIEQERRKNQTPANSGSSKADYASGGTAPRRPTVRLSLPLEQPVSLPNPETPQTQRELRNPSVTPPQTMTLQLDPAIKQSQTAYETAQMLRQRQERREAEYEEQFLPRRRSRRRLPLLRRLRRSLFTRSSHSDTPEAVPFTLRETLTLLFGAALTRLLINLLLEAVPLLLIPTMILLVVPAAIAVHRTTTSPQAGITWGYRLCVILLGLLIGGRL